MEGICYLLIKIVYVWGFFLLVVERDMVRRSVMFIIVFFDIVIISIV